MHNTATGPTVIDEARPTVKPRNKRSILVANITFTSLWSQNRKIPCKYIKNILESVTIMQNYNCILCALCDFIVENFLSEMVNCAR